ncbi:hypothetical protein JCM10908_006730 [Rhodotorula pacifica]|uniref:glycoside hydrolase family protein n=1 Tax=Rhodotorula pacifica TaxID=1495444 RepID=UPI00316D1B8D
MHFSSLLSCTLLLTASFAHAASSRKAAPSATDLAAREHEAEYEIAKAQRLIRRARTYKPSKVTTHKKEVFARRLHSWEAIAHQIEQEKQHGSQPNAVTTTSKVAAVTTTTSKPAAATQAVPAQVAPVLVATGSKRGVGYNDAALTLKLDLGWAYNWAQTPGGKLNAGVEYVPMLWSDNAGDWVKNANAALASGSSHLLAFNEPDLAGQAEMTVEQSVTAWKQYMSPFVGKAKLGSMAVTNGAAPMGTDYIKRFFDACPECEKEVDFIALHWYDSALNSAYFEKHLQDAHALLGKPIWLTEFAGSGSVSEQQAFLKEVIAWMEAPEQSYIQRYAGFGDFIGTYVADASGALTPLGVAYPSA